MNLNDIVLITVYCATISWQYAGINLIRVEYNCVVEIISLSLAQCNPYLVSCAFYTKFFQLLVLLTHAAQSSATLACSIYCSAYVLLMWWHWWGWAWSVTVYALAIAIVWLNIQLTVSVSVVLVCSWSWTFACTIPMQVLTWWMNSPSGFLASLLQHVLAAGRISSSCCANTMRSLTHRNRQNATSTMRSWRCCICCQAVTLDRKPGWALPSSRVAW